MWCDSQVMNDKTYRLNGLIPGSGMGRFDERFSLSI